MSRNTDDCHTDSHQRSGASTDMQEARSRLPAGGPMNIIAGGEVAETFRPLPTDDEWERVQELERGETWVRSSVRGWCHERP